MPRKKVNTEVINFYPTQYNYKGSIIKIITNEIQETSKGIKFKYKSITKNKHINSIWVNGVEKWHWIYKFEYIYYSEKGFILEIDYYDNIVSLKQF